MNGFVRIITMFTSEKDRNIETLSEKYYQKSDLMQVIKSIVENDLLTRNSIKNKKILLKPNWVLHNRKQEDNICLRTHENFILAALELLLKEKPEKITIGDAPIQGCNWYKMLPSEFYEAVEALSQKHGIPVIIKDFRRVTFNTKKNNPVKERNPLSEYLIFDLGTESHLEPISSSKKNIFRVTDYDPDRLAVSHTKGVHKYCITKELFDADIIISLPKIKTHQKAGVTAALKNIVGLNGDKDFLPHHRIGGTGFGGDCYPGRNYLRLWAELALDQANRNQGKSIYRIYSKLSAILWRLSNPKSIHQIAAAWHGNDTTWRMVLDLNKIAIYGKNDGTISKEPQRRLYSLGDGIIGGQGDGPLKTVPLPLGIITFSNHSSINDVAMGMLMGFDILKIPLLRTAFETSKEDVVEITLNGEKKELKALKKIALKTLPPPGWIEYLQ